MLCGERTRNACKKGVSKVTIHSILVIYICCIVSLKLCLVDEMCLSALHLGENAKTFSISFLSFCRSYPHEQLVSCEPRCGLQCIKWYFMPYGKMNVLLHFLCNKPHEMRICHTTNCKGFWIFRVFHVFINASRKYHMTTSMRAVVHFFRVISLVYGILRKAYVVSRQNHLNNNPMHYFC